MEGLPHWGSAVAMLGTLYRVTLLHTWGTFVFVRSFINALGKAEAAFFGILDPKVDLYT